MQWTQTWLLEYAAGNESVPTEIHGFPLPSLCLSASLVVSEIFRKISGTGKIPKCYFPENFQFGRGFRHFIRQKIFHNVVLSSRKELHCRFIAEELSTSYFFIIWCGIVTRFVCKRVSIVIWLFVQVEYHHFVCKCRFGWLNARLYHWKKKLNWKDFLLSLTFNELRSVFVFGSNFELFDSLCSLWIGIRAFW